MIRVFNYEGKNEEDCRLKCLEDLDVYNNEIITKEYEENELFKMEVIKKEDVISYIKEYLKEVTSKMGIETKIEVEEIDEIFNVKMFSNNNPLLIGKDGKNLTSIQHLIRQTISNKIKFNLKINVDASNYKAKKEKYFERNIKTIINDVLKSKDEVKLDPMNSFKRRIVHSIVNDYYNLETESVGEEPNRCVIIRYIEK